MERAREEVTSTATFQSRGEEPGTVRVFYLIESLNMGGSEHQMVEVARRLDPTRYRVVVGCLQARGPLLGVLQEAGIRVVEFPPGGSLLRPRAVFQLLRLARFLRHQRFEVFHAHDLYSNLMGVPAARLAGVPVILSSRRDLGSWWWDTPLRVRVIRKAHKLSTAVVANSQAVRDYLIGQHGMEASRIRVILNAVDTSRFAGVHADRQSLLPGTDSSHKLVAVVANMHSQIKGHKYLIEAGVEVCRAVPQVRFLLVGDGTERPTLERQVADLGLSRHFLFLGHRGDVPQILSCSDVLVLPSLAEGFPNVVLEAMAAGRPVVATRVGGVSELVEDGRTGSLVPAKDPKALAEALLVLLQDNELARRLGSAGAERARTQFSFERLLAELTAFYRELLHRPAGN